MSTTTTMNVSLWAEPAQLPSDLYTPPMDDTLWAESAQPSYDDNTPPNPSDQPFTLTLSPIKINSLHTITLSPIPMQPNYQHYMHNIPLNNNLNDTHISTYNQ